MNSRPRAEELARLLVSWPSITGTSGEAAFPGRLAALLETLPAFDRKAIRTIPSHGDPITASVAALSRGSGRRTIVFAGHFDVVSIDNYLGLRDLAFDPDALTKALIAELETGSMSAKETLALADLRSGDFLPGRGMLDMKSGLAAGVAAVELWAREPERQGNILFAAMPDEENRSRGMRSFRDALGELAEEWNLDIVGGINLDASEDNGDGSDGQAVFFGTVGKFSPFAHVVGRATHAGYPFGGVSAHLIAAEIIRAIETNPDLSDEAFGERSPPPICLESRDFRQAYDVTTPDQVWASFNWLTHGRRPAELLDLFASIVEDAANQAVRRQAESAIEHGAAESSWLNPRVLTVADLLGTAEQRGGDDFRGRHVRLVSSLEQEENPLVISQTIVRSLVDEAGLEGPAVVVGFASLHYAHTHADPDDPRDARFRRCVQAAARGLTARHGAPIRIAEFFQGISDMSFFGHSPDAGDADLVARSSPSPALIDKPNARDSLSFPVANIGPWGRQFHQKLERVHAPYTFEVLPELLLATVKSLLETE